MRGDRYIQHQRWTTDEPFRPSPKLTPEDRHLDGVLRDQVRAMTASSATADLGDIEQKVQHFQSPEAAEAVLRIARRRHKALQRLA